MLVQMKKYTLLLLFFILGLVLGCDSRPRVQWEDFSEAKIAEARQAGKPVLIDFYAAWCGPCMVMKNTTFRDTRLIAALQPIVRLKADMSFSRSEKNQTIINQYRVSGFPTLILLGPGGNEMTRFGFVRAHELLRILKRYENELGTTIRTTE